MRLLFELDRHDYDNCTHSFVRNSARSIIIRNGKIAMVHSLKYDFYKFPGGGINKDESPVEAMIRETREESGLIVIPETVREYGYVHRIQRSGIDPTEVFIQDNYYYICDAEEKPAAQNLDDYELKDAFTLEFVDPHIAIETDLGDIQSPYDRAMFVREAKVLKMLIDEGWLK